MTLCSSLVRREDHPEGEGDAQALAASLLGSGATELGSNVGLLDAQGPVCCGDIRGFSTNLS